MPALPISLIWMTLSGATQMPHDAATPIAHIERTDSAAGSEFVATARSDQAFSGDFRLLFTRQGPNGNATTRQGGRVALAPGDIQRLTVIRVGPITSDDVWQATLELIDDGVVVASQTLSQPQADPEP